MFGLGATIPATDIETVKAFFRDDKAVIVAIKSYEQGAADARRAIEELNAVRAEVDAMRSAQEARLLQREEALAAQAAALAEREAELKRRAASIEADLTEFEGVLTKQVAAHDELQKMTAALNEALS